MEDSRDSSDELLILVVTDNASVRAEFEFGFPSGIRVAFAREARDAWDLLAGEVPAAVIVDLQTGSAGGFALTRDMQATDRLAHVPVVMLLEREQDAWLARQAGARMYRVKPVEPADLITDMVDLLPSA